MKRFAGLIALIGVVFAVALASSSASGASLGLCTALVLGGVLVHKLIQSAESADASRVPSGVRGFAAAVAQNTMRFAIGALTIAWMVVSLQWLAAVIG